MVCHLWDWSVETHSREEGDRTALLLNEPVERLSKHALASVTEIGEDRVETALGGDSLPATVKQGDKTVTNLSNLVAMEADDGDA